MADGQPKNYSNMDQDELPPPPPVRFASGANNQKRVNGWSDGYVSRPRHRENGLDLAELSRRLKKLPIAEIAMDSLRVHYSDVFEKRRDQPTPPTKIKVILNYAEENETYIFSIPRNNANLVKDLAPRKGSYRYFFEHPDKSFEEIMGDIEVPIQATRSIKCKVFSA